MTGTVNSERYASHLSEFYPILNSNDKGGTNANEFNKAIGTEEENGTNNIANQIKRLNVSGVSLSRRASSVNSNVSAISDLQTFITKRDVKRTSEVINLLHNNSMNYSASLRQSSLRAGEMASSLEDLAKLKGCNDDTAEKLLSASGLFHLMSNHDIIMAQCIQNLMGNELIDDIDEFNMKSKQLENKFKAESKEQSIKLKMQEKLNNKLSKRKIRNLLSYRESLNSLQTQLDQLETLRHDYFVESYSLVESTCNNVLNNVASVTRAQLDISENIARKGWSGGGLDDLLIGVGDPFSKEEEEAEEEVEEEAEEETEVEAEVEAEGEMEEQERRGEEQERRGEEEEEIGKDQQRQDNAIIDENTIDNRNLGQGEGETAFEPYNEGPKSRQHDLTVEYVSPTRRIFGANQSPTGKRFNSELDDRDKHDYISEGQLVAHNSEDMDNDNDTENSNDNNSEFDNSFSLPITSNSNGSEEN